MGDAAGGKPPRVFDCAVCKLSVPYSWHGRRPKFGEQLVFVEDVYMTATPRHRPYDLAPYPCSRLESALPTCFPTFNLKGGRSAL